MYFRNMGCHSVSGQKPLTEAPVEVLEAGLAIATGRTIKPLEATSGQHF